MRPVLWRTILIQVGQWKKCTKLGLAATNVTNLQTARIVDPVNSRLFNAVQFYKFSEDQVYISIYTKAVSKREDFGQAEQMIIDWASEDGLSVQEFPLLQHKWENVWKFQVVPSDSTYNSSIFSFSSRDIEKLRMYACHSV